jgi:hypothetical protein
MRDSPRTYGFPIVTVWMADCLLEGEDWSKDGRLGDASRAWVSSSSSPEHSFLAAALVVFELRP